MAAQNSTELKYVPGTKLPHSNIPGMKFDPNFLPSDYSPYFMMKESDAKGTYENAPDVGVVYTTQPPIPLGATLKEFPNGWSECLLDPAAKKHIVTTDGFPAHLPCLEGPPRYRIASSPIAGEGMFATRAIKAGQLILAERATIIVPNGLSSPAELDTRTGKDMYRTIYAHTEKTLEVLFDRLLPEQKERFMTLHNSHLNDGSGPILGIVRTNGYFVSEFGTGKSYAGIFDKLSRINHSCGPNLSRFFDPRSFCMKMFAIRNIEEGEELTASYCDIRAPTAARQKALEPYGFKCACMHCTDPRSDARRKRIVKEFDASVTGPRLQMWIQNRRLPQEMLINEATEALSIMEREGVESLGHYSANVMHLCCVLNALGRDFTPHMERFLRLLRSVEADEANQSICLFFPILQNVHRARVDPGAQLDDEEVLVKQMQGVMITAARALQERYFESE